MDGTEEQLNKALDRKDPIVFPDLASDDVLKDFPPAVIVDSEFDFFIEGAIDFSNRLREQGRLLEFINYPGSTHSFNLYANLARAEDWQKNFVEILDKYLK